MSEPPGRLWLRCRGQARALYVSWGGHRSQFHPGLPAGRRPRSEHLAEGRGRATGLAPDFVCAPALTRSSGPALSTAARRIQTTRRTTASNDPVSEPRWSGVTCAQPAGSQPLLPACLRRLRRPGGAAGPRPTARHLDPVTRCGRSARPPSSGVSQFRPTT